MLDDVVQTMVERITERFRPLRIVPFGLRARADGFERRRSSGRLAGGSNKRHVAMEIRRVLSDLPVCTTAETWRGRELSRGSLWL